MHFSIRYRKNVTGNLTGSSNCKQPNITAVETLTSLEKTNALTADSADIDNFQLTLLILTRIWTLQRLLILQTQY